VTTIQQALCLIGKVASHHVGVVDVIRTPNF
jgi:hypothetical protein